jgi:hypothetical protein
MKKILLIAVAALTIESASTTARADDLDWDRLNAARVAAVGACDLGIRIHADDSGQHLDVHMGCERTGSDDEVFRFTGLNNPQDGSAKKRVCPRAPNIEAVERIDRAAFMVYIRCVETEAHPRGLVFKLEGDTLHIYNNENF